MFSRVPTTSLLPPATAFEPGSCSAILQAKLAGLHHFVVSSLAEAATVQKYYYGGAYEQIIATDVSLFC